MADRKASNKYIPPDFDPKKHSGVNAYVGQHPLRQRASKLKTEGILVVRFELPYSIWCLSCNEHIGMGVRYNAEKKQIGKYYSTPVWEFRMKCHLCSGLIVIQTDPKASEYVLVSGGRKRVESFDSKDAGTYDLGSTHNKELLESNPFFQLEHAQQDQSKALADKPHLEKLQVS
jgi:coiled-coil domain-containing protein 130